MFSWMPEEEEIPEATWEEYSLYYWNKFKMLTMSEYDQNLKASIYFMEKNITSNDKINKLDFIPQNFLTQYFVRTRQGLLNISNF